MLPPCPEFFTSATYLPLIYNSGQGGNTDIYPVSKLTGEIISEANSFLASQPKKKCDMFNFEYIRTVESEVDDLLADWLQVKEDKKLLKQMDKGILYGTKYHYQMIYWKNMSIPAMLNNTTCKARLIQVVKDLKAKGETILNTNLPDDIIGN